MKQSIGNYDGSVSSSAMLTADECEVLEILVQLPRLILESEARRRFPFTWGSKRRRSAIDATLTPPRLHLSSSPTLPSPLHQDTCGGAGGGADVAPACENAGPPVVKAKASSPATPLSFSPSESDEKPNLLRRKASLKVKRNLKREDYIKMIEELTKEKESHHGNIKNEERNKDQLRALNLKLKAMKEERSLGPKRVMERENPCSEIGLQTQLVHSSVNSSNSMPQHQDFHLQHQMPSQFPFPSTAHYLPLILNQTARPSHISGSEGVVLFQHESSEPTTSFPVTSSSGSALAMVNNNMAPVGIPDLNVPVDESIAMDSCRPLDRSVANKNLIRAMAAQARQKRIKIYRFKNPIGIIKSRHSYR